MTTITNLPAAVEGLREIVGRMTPGEWFQPDGAEGDLWNNDAEPGERQTPDRVVVQSPSKPSWVKDRTWDEWRSENEHNLAGIVALRNTALPIIDAQAARIAELEAEVARLSAIVQGWHYLAVGPDEMGDYYTHKQLVKLSEPYGHPSLAVLNGGNHE